MSSFLYNTVWEIFVLRSYYRDLIKAVYQSPTTVLIILCNNLMKFEFCRKIFKVKSKINLNEFQSSGIRVIPKKLTERQGNGEGHKAAELMIMLICSCRAITMPYLNTDVFSSNSNSNSFAFFHSIQKQECIYFFYKRRGSLIDLGLDEILQAT